LLLAGVERTAKAEAAMADAPPPTITVISGTASVVNDAVLDQRARNWLAPVFGSRLEFIPATVVGGVPSEDYSEFQTTGMQSVFFGIGGASPATIAEYKAKGTPPPVNHSPFFAPDPEPTIKTGVEVLTLSVLLVAQEDAGAAPKR
jgi:hippurate hydrolase